MAKQAKPDGPRRGRPSKLPRSPFGQLLWRHLRSLRLTQQELATRLGVSAATVSRLVRGRAERFEKLSGDDVCAELKLDEVTRREFFQLAGSVGMVFAGAIRVDTRQVPEVLRYRRIDLDVHRAALHGWEVALSHDHDPREVLAEVLQVNGRLRALEPVRPDSSFAELRVRSATLLAAAQEAVEPWRADRPERATATYESANDDLGLLPHDRAIEQYVRMRVRHAVLRREGGRAAVCAAELAALGEHTVLAAADPVLEIGFLCQRMHTISYKGVGSERDWSIEGEKIRRRIEAMAVPPELRAELHAILTYTYGVGNKAFMWRLVGPRQTPSPLALRYASKAFEYLQSLRESGLGGVAVRHINIYHPSVSATLVEPEFESSLIDALVWHDPREAARRMEVLAIQAERRYPAVLRKIEEDRRLLKRRFEI